MKLLNLNSRFLLLPKAGFSFVLFLMVFFISEFPAFGQESDEENLNVFWDWLRWNDPGNLSTLYFMEQADLLYNQRTQKIAGLNSSEDWLARQAFVKEKLNKLLPPFPVKTDLNPIITGKVQKEGYHFEKIIYESIPGKYVTGCLFVPDGLVDKAPAILYLIGHEQNSFREELNQIMYQNFVKKGFVVLTIDPIGQGEMIQYYDPEIGFSSIGYSVIEHMYLGNACFLAGDSPARYFTWDAVRGIDFLVTRPEVDSGRIGVTGFSGGGTITSYVSAIDDRVKVSVPCSWSTASRRQVETKGTQDAESIFVGGIAEGISFEDLVEVRAPKPTMMTFTSRDQYLSIQGAIESYREIRKAYTTLGSKENIQLVQDDYKHWMTPKIRKAIFAFFLKHMEVSGSPEEEEIDLIPEEELQVTPTGQVSTWRNGETVYSINKRICDSLQLNLEKSRRNIEKHLSEVKSKAMAISGFKIPISGNTNPFLNGRYQREGYTIARYAIKGEGNYEIPILLFMPDNTGPGLPAIIYIHPEGKSFKASPGDDLEELVKKGYIIAAVDLLGIGELKNTSSRPATDDYTALLVGRSMPGVQAADIVRVNHYLKSLDQVNPDRIGIIGVREMGIPILHAAAFDSAINNVILIDPLISYRSVVMNKIYRLGLIKRQNGGTHHPYEVEFDWGVPGVLTAYDLPDLMGCIAPRKLLISGFSNQLLEPASTKDTDKDMAFLLSVYSHKKAMENFIIKPSQENFTDLVDWCFK